MAPRPVLIFQKISPSDSAWTFLDVQSAGLGLSAAAAAPSPLPLAPWQDTQLVFATFSPPPRPPPPPSPPARQKRPGAQPPRHPLPQAPLRLPPASQPCAYPVLQDRRLLARPPVVGETSGGWQDPGGPPPRRSISEKIHKSTTPLSSRP